MGLAHNPRTLGTTPSVSHGDCVTHRDWPGWSS